MKAKKILFITSEITPFVAEEKTSLKGRILPQSIQELGHEIRTFTPKWGTINERRNQLHEVIRLSGMNLIIDDTDHPLIIKVASLPSARMQIYFIDNDDYFRRKQITFDTDGKFFEDNGQRAIFFARGVLETVKKLRWAPDVIHCQGWISHLVPLYLKKVYNGDPIFSGSKIVTSLYNEIAGEGFAPSFKDNTLFGGVKAADVALLDNPTGINLAETAALYSDGIIFADKDIDPELVKFCQDKNIPTLPFNEESIASGRYIEEYDEFYQQLQ